MTDAGSQGLRVRVLPGPDLAAGIALLARAFRDTPLNRAVLKDRDDDARLRANRHGMRAQVPVAQQHGQVLGAWQGAELAAVLVAAPPHAHPFPPPALAVRLRSWLGQGFAVAARWGRVFDALQRHHMVEPHWYLGTLGVDPPRQGQGIGGALLKRWLVDVDAEGMPAWLETDSERNLSLYGREGFCVEKEIRVLDVPVWLLRREGRKTPAWGGSARATPGTG